MRSREMAGLMFLLALILCVVVSSGVQNSGIPRDMTIRLFAVLVWVAFLFNATLSIERSFDCEKEQGAMESLLLLARVPAAIFYCAKLSSNFLIMLCGHAFTSVILAGLLDVSLAGRILSFSAISVLVVFAYSCAATLLAALAVRARLKQLLLPLILLPMLFPLFFAATELTADLLVANRFDLSSPWLSLALGLDALYFLLGINLFEYVLKE